MFVAAKLSLDSRCHRVLISNPNDVTTNLVLVNQDLQRLETADSIRAINGLLHSLDWQAPASDALISLARR